MKRRLFLYVLCAVFFVTGIIGCWLLHSNPQGQWVDILQDGNVIHRVDLSRAEDRLITVDFHGSLNIIEIKDGEIRVIEADCPDKTCVRMGALNESGLPIVCLPNRLVIQFTESGGGTDAVT